MRVTDAASTLRKPRWWTRAVHPGHPWGQLSVLPTALPPLTYGGVTCPPSPAPALGGLGGVLGMEEPASLRPPGLAVVLQREESFPLGWGR